MSSSTLLIAATALVGIINAVPVQNTGIAFSIEQVPYAVHLKNGPADMIKMLQKHGQDVPEDIQIAATIQAATTGSDTATPSDAYDSSYLCPVVVGNTTLQLDFDTGSSDL